MKKSLLILAICLCVNAFSQQVNWTGNALNNDFFDENNWLDANTSLPPASGTIDVNQAINLNLQLHNAGNSSTVANGVINLGTGTLSVTSGNLEAQAISGGSVSINENAYIDLSLNAPFQNNVAINFTSGIGWVRTTQLNTLDINNNHLTQILVNGAAAIYGSNLRIDQYYYNGAVIRRNNMATTPLTIYTDENRQGSSANLSLDIIHNGANIPNSLNNNVESFILKKGFMVTFADVEDGTGKSKNYIASEEDLIVDVLPSYLINNISFIRVLPWNWVDKKGRSGNITDNALNNTWFYRWNNTGDATLDLEYATMAWGGGAADSDADINIYKGEYKATHILGFNEPDDCNAQSGQFVPPGYTEKLCNTDVAVDLYKNLMKTGLRMVSPAGREEAPFGWLKEFHDKANAQDIRIDVIAVHWYDWGSNPAANPNPTALQVFNRFKTYLTNVYNLYGLPIWITEFNANPNRNNAINLAFMELALPYLESLPYVERYVWFQPSSGTADYFDGSNNITNVGTFYKNQVSTKSIPENTVTEDSNLDIYYNLINPTGTNLLINGNFETGDLTGWNGTNTGILSSPNANVYEGTTTGRILANAGSIQQTVTVQPLVDYDLSFYTKWFVVPPAAISVQILNADTDAVITSKLMTTSTDWNLVELNFTVPSGVTSIKFSVEKSASYPGWFIDNAILAESTTLALDDFDSGAFKVYPNPSTDIFVLKGNSTIKSYTIFDLQGRVTNSKKNLFETKTVIDLKNKEKGIYFIIVRDIKGNQSTKKLIFK